MGLLLFLIFNVAGGFLERADGNRLYHDKVKSD